MLTLLSFSDHIQIYPPNKQESNGLNQTHVYYVMQERKKSPWSALKQVGISSKGEKTNVCNTIIIRSPFRENDNFSFFAVSTHFYQVRVWHMTQYTFTQEKKSLPKGKQSSCRKVKRAKKLCDARREKKTPTALTTKTVYANKASNHVWTSRCVRTNVQRRFILLPVLLLFHRAHIAGMQHGKHTKFNQCKIVVLLLSPFVHVSPITHSQAIYM